MDSSSPPQSVSLTQPGPQGQTPSRPLNNSSFDSSSSSTIGITGWKCPDLSLNKLGVFASLASMTVPVLCFIHIPLRKLHVEPTLATVVYWGKGTNAIKNHKMESSVWFGVSSPKEDSR